jgi:hypothetical protein
MRSHSAMMIINLDIFCAIPLALDDAHSFYHQKSYFMSLFEENAMIKRN